MAAVALGLLTALTGGCRPFYVAQVGVQHVRYMSRARPIAEEIRATSDATRRRRLELVLAAREFADRNGLEPGGSYLKVSNTEGLSAGYVVTAAHQDRLEPYEWSYPVVGRIPYRGYFDRGEADGFAAAILRDGYDTYVFAAAGYSTLGWFDDPLPSGLLAYDDVGLVDVVLHELVHQNVYVKDEIAFNETLASAVSKRLTIDFFRARGEHELADEADGRYRLWRGQSAVFDEFAARLQRYFAASAHDGRTALLAGRRLIYDDLMGRLHALEPGRAAPDVGAPAVMNNAVFLALWRYRKQADLLGSYLDTFDGMADAMDDLRKRAEGSGLDPYASIADRVRRADCCSEDRTVMSSGKGGSGQTLVATSSDPTRNKDHERASTRDPELVRR